MSRFFSCFGSGVETDPDRMFDFNSLLGHFDGSHGELFKYLSQKYPHIVTLVDKLTEFGINKTVFDFDDTIVKNLVDSDYETYGEDFPDKFCQGSFPNNYELKEKYRAGGKKSKELVESIFFDFQEFLCLLMALKLRAEERGKKQIDFYIFTGNSQNVLTQVLESGGLISGGGLISSDYINIKNLHSSGDESRFKGDRTRFISENVGQGNKLLYVDDCLYNVECGGFERNLVKFGGDRRFNPGFPDGSQQGFSTGFFGEGKYRNLCSLISDRIRVNEKSLSGEGTTGEGTTREEKNNPSDGFQHSSGERLSEAYQGPTVSLV